MDVFCVGSEFETALTLHVFLVAFSSGTGLFFPRRWDSFEGFLQEDTTVGRGVTPRIELGLAQAPPVFFRWNIYGMSRYCGEEDRRLCFDYVTKRWLGPWQSTGSLEATDLSGSGSTNDLFRYSLKGFTEMLAKITLVALTTLRTRRSGRLP